MIGIDTNVLVRYIAQDDHKQSPLATNLIDGLTAQDPGFITCVALVELVWVMQSCYRANKAEVVTILQTVLRASQLQVENRNAVQQALSLFEHAKSDFADCLIDRASHLAGCVHTVTFDKSAAGFGAMKLLT